MSLDTITGRPSPIKDQLRACPELRDYAPGHCMNRPVLSRRDRIAADLAKPTYLVFWSYKGEINVRETALGCTWEEVVADIATGEITNVVAVKVMIGTELRDVTKEVAEAVSEFLIDAHDKCLIDPHSTYDHIASDAFFIEHCSDLIEEFHGHSSGRLWR